MKHTLASIHRAIEGLKQATLISVKEDLTVAEAALYMGISKGKVYDLLSHTGTKSPELAHHKPNGKLIWIPKSECDKWIRRGRVESRDVIETEADKILQRLEKKRA